MTLSTDPSRNAALSSQIAAEQEYVDSLFARLDDEVTTANLRLRDVEADVDPHNPDAEALVRRETEYHSLNEKIDRLNVAQMGLVFGRIDVEGQNPDLIDNPVPGQPLVDRRYIGRMGLDDKDDNYRTLLLDWRAPLARPFYLATTAAPEGVLTRRHIRTRGRTVTHIDEEQLSGDDVSGDSIQQASSVAGEGALFSAMQAARTGRMSSIVETIQREQDEIIRDATRGAMVVEGGPGTGKTAVALHRVAYLLYTWREQLAKTGVLIIGPNRTFLDYISHVLPELGETGVVLSTVGELYPGVSPSQSESLLTREIKGSDEMVTILDRLVKSYQNLPEVPVTITVDNIDLTVDESMVKKARTRARRGRRPHNLAQPLFKESLTEQLSFQLAEIIGKDPLGGNLLSAADVAQLHDDLMQEPAIDDLVDTFWPQLNPTDLLAELVSSRDKIAEVAFDYDDETQHALFREDATAYAASDAALLDELAQLVGLPDPEEEKEAERKRWREQLEEAQDALDVLSSSEATDNDDETDAEILSAFDVIDAETLAMRQQEADVRTTAERAQSDHTWVYGHVIIDEAQELTPMEWRMVMRRCPSRWMTIVGDTSQTGSPAGVDSWAETLEPYVGNRFRTHQLTINYRTPAEIMEVANSIQKMFAPHVEPSVSLRATGHPVTMMESTTDLEQLVQEITAQDADRSVAVIGADSAANQLIRGVSDIKGLEFDHVIVVEPQDIISGSPQGWQNLFVALTRATQSLTVVGELPA